MKLVIHRLLSSARMVLAEPCFDSDFQTWYSATFPNCLASYFVFVFMLGLVDQLVHALTANPGRLSLSPE